MEPNNYSFKKLLWIYIFAVIPFSVLASLGALFGWVPVIFNGKPTVGLKGFMVPLCFIPFMGLMFACCNWLALNFGNTIYKLVFRKKEQDEPIS